MARKTFTYIRASKDVRRSREQKSTSLGGSKAIGHLFNGSHKVGHVLKLVNHDGPLEGTYQTMWVDCGCLDGTSLSRKKHGLIERKTRPYREKDA